ncbi:MAG: alpha/beta fold hydrolase [Pseudooceanicola sp.]
MSGPNETTIDALAYLDQVEKRADLAFTGGDGQRIAWRCWGQGRPVVLLHGASGSWRHWIRQVDALKGRRLIVADLPGYGQSDTPAEPLDVEAMTSAVCDGIDDLVGAGGGYDLVAFSYGGSVAAHILRRHKGRHGQVFLCAPAGFGTPAMPPTCKVRGLKGAALHAAHRQNLGSIMIAEPDRIDALAVAIQDVNTRLSRLRPTGVSRNARLAEALADSDAQITVVWGARDAFLTGGGVTSRAEMVLKHRPDARVHIIPDAGHWIAYEADEAVNALMANTLSDG